jgi:uncharacterized protein YlxP (DUF503 family)
MPVIGVLTLELRVEASHSLKDKRHVVKSLKDRLRARFNVSVAEIDGQDSWQRSVIAAAAISGDRVKAERLLQSVENEAASILGGDLVGTSVEWLE